MIPPGALRPTVSSHHLLIITLTCTHHYAGICASTPWGKTSRGGTPTLGLPAPPSSVTAGDPMDIIITIQSPIIGSGGSANWAGGLIQQVASKGRVSCAVHARTHLRCGWATRRNLGRASNAGGSVSAKLDLKSGIGMLRPRLIRVQFEMRPRQSG